MGWSYRKSIGAAPFKINFSKKGISYSFGMKGARVNVSSRGTYVKLSAHGITYRQKISGPAAPPAPVVSPITPTGSVTEIASAQVEQLTDTDSKAFVTTLNQKCRQPSYVKRWGIFPLSIILLILLSTTIDGQQEIVYVVSELVICLACFIPLIYWLKKLDKKRLGMSLHYDMDDKYQQVYQQFKTHFTTFTQSSRIWQYLNTQRNTDYKRNAGAAALIKRIRINGVSAHKVPLPYFVTNVAIPCITLHNMELYFFPERLLIRRGNTFAAVFYKHLHITSYVSRFIESDSLPADAKVIDYTWQYVNKAGGPDKRFNNNRRLPICAYSDYMFTSDTGIFEIISTSKQSSMDNFVDFLSKIGELQSSIDGYYQ